MKKITIIDYGAGNVKSVAFACERLGFETELTNDKNKIVNAEKVIFPGVGHADYAMQQLKKNNLIEVIKNLKQPTLGVCLGMQLMCSHTEEGNVDGIGIFNLPVKAFSGDIKVPHMGWNKLEDTKGILSDLNEYVYFVHSYFVPKNEYSIANCTYGETFSAALQKDNFYACQFHPEKSGEIGEEILNRFLNL